MLGRLSVELDALRREQRSLHGALVERLGPPPLPEPDLGDRTPVGDAARAAAVLPLRRRTTGAAPAPTTGP